MFTYIVSGMRRTGTSMMMHCLGLGGLELVYDESRDRALHREFPNNPNKFFYELELPKAIWLPLTKGKCTKAMGATCLNRGIAPIKIVYMVREPKAQFESVGAACVPELNDYQKQSKKYITELESSNETDSLTVLDYDEVLEKPLKAFYILEKYGWPIDAFTASTGVDRSLKHY